MKKLLKISLLLLFVMLLNVTYVNAANPTISFVPSSTSVKAGETFDLAVSVKCETDFEGLTGVLDFDKSKVEIVNKVNAAKITDMNAEDSQGRYNLTIMQEGTGFKEGTCQTLTFKIKSGVTAGEEIKISTTVAIKDGDNKQNASSSATIKVASEEQPGTNPATDSEGEEEGNPNQNPSETPGETPSETPTETPTEKPTEKPAEKPADNTKANKPIDYAGVESIVLITTCALALVGLVAYICYKRYENI